MAGMRPFLFSTGRPTHLFSIVPMAASNSVDPRGVAARARWFRPTADGAYVALGLLAYAGVVLPLPHGDSAFLQFTIFWTIAASTLALVVALRPSASAHAKVPAVLCLGMLLFGHWLARKPQIFAGLAGQTQKEDAWRSLPLTARRTAMWDLEWSRNYLFIGGSYTVFVANLIRRQPTPVSWVVSIVGLFFFLVFLCAEIVSIMSLFGP